MGGEGVIGGDDGPAVFEGGHGAISKGGDGFDGDDLAGFDFFIWDVWILEVEDEGVFVDLVSNSVSAKIFDN